MNWIPKIEYTDFLDGTPKVITFDSPPEGDPLNEEVIVNSRKTKSNNGREQVQFNYLEAKYNFEFLFQTEAVKQEIYDFFTRHASRGAEFNYFQSSDEAEFETFTLSDKGIKFGRPIPAATPGEFEYDFSFNVNRVLNVV